MTRCSNTVVGLVEQTPRLTSNEVAQNEKMAQSAPAHFSFLVPNHCRSRWMPSEARLCDDQKILNFWVGFRLAYL